VFIPGRVGGSPHTTLIGAGAQHVRRPTTRATLTDGIDQSLITVFQQDWWIEAAGRTGRRAHAQVVADGVIVARLAYMVRRSRLGLRWAAAPDWTHLSGPVLSQSLSRAEKADALRQIMAQLPRGLSFGFVGPSHTADADLIRDAVRAAGFVHSLETTYSQSPAQADVMARLTRKHRLHIRAAERVLDIEDSDADEFIAAYARNLREAGRICHMDLEAARAVIARGMALSPPQVRVMAARQRRVGAKLDAAIACAWDRSRYYFWMSTRRLPAADETCDRPHPDAIKLLIIHAMAHAHALGLTFDADGVQTPGATTLYRDILRIPNQEFRDVFERVPSLVRRHNRLVGAVKRTLARLRPG
jgi:hypothetical protein